MNIRNFHTSRTAATMARVLPLAVALHLLPFADFSPAHAADFSVYGGGGGGGGLDGAGGAGGAGGDGSPGGNGGDGVAGGGGGGGGGGGTGSPGNDGGNGNASGHGGGGAGGVDASGHSGAGGHGGNGGPDGKGIQGDGASAAASSASFANVTVGGGNGGNGGAGSNGGNVVVDLADTSIEDFSVQGGMGGTNVGGDGGDVVANLTGGSVGALSMQSGAAGSTGSTGGTGGNVSLAADTLRTGSLILIKNDGDLSLNISKALVWTGSGTFSVTGSGANITIGSLTIDGSTVNSSNFGNLISADSIYTDKTITLGKGGATFDTGGGDQSVGRALAGAGGLTKQGTGTLTLTGNSRYTGGATISEGTLKGNIASGTDLSIAIGARYDGDNAARFVSALSGGGTVSRTNGLIVQSGDFAGIIDGSNTGGLIKTGTGALTLTGNNSYTGGATISEGTLKGNIASGTDLSIAIGASYDGGNAARFVSALSGGGTVSRTNGLIVQSGDFAGIIDNTNTGGLTKTGTGALTLTGNNSYTSGTTISEGTLKGNIASGTDLSIAIGASYDGDNAARFVSTLSGGGTVSRTNGLIVQSGDFAGIIDSTNTGGLTKTGTGALTLTGNNSYTGGTTISGGTLSIGSDANIGAGINTIGDNGTLLLSGNAATYTKGWTLGGANSAIEAANDNTLSGDLSGSGALTKTGAGALTLTGSNTYAGDTIIRGGTLQGGIADNTNLRIAAGASYDGADAARSLNILSGGGVIRNTNGLSIQSGDFGGVIDDSNTGRTDQDRNGRIDADRQQYLRGRHHHSRRHAARRHRR